ncbi:MAG: PorV/PorQ family protein [Bacteroidetes bacterium]|nr:PorV/PorQ family protein [Bacteroidota bacterium]
MNKRVSFLVIVLGLVVGFSSTSKAGNPSRTGTGAALELLIPVGARGQALGGAFVSGISGVDAIYWNPAGLALASNNVEAMFSHMNYIADIGVNYFALGAKLGDVGSLALSLKSINFGSITQTTNEFPDGGIGTYSPSYVTAAVTYSKGLTDRILAGITVKYVSEQIMRENASGVAFDAGIQYRAEGTGLKIGIVVRNIGTNMQFAGDDLSHVTPVPGSNSSAPSVPLYIQAASFEMPSTVDLGLSYDLRLNDENTFTITGTFRNNNFGSDNYLAGAEYNFNNMLYLRGGWVFSNNASGSGLVSQTEDNIFGPTLGAGIKYNLGGTTLSVDYAYRTTKFFAGNNTISVQVGL